MMDTFSQLRTGFPQRFPRNGLKTCGELGSLFRSVSSTLSVAHLQRLEQRNSLYGFSLSSPIQRRWYACSAQRIWRRHIFMDHLARAQTYSALPRESCTWFVFPLEYFAPT